MQVIDWNDLSVLRENGPLLALTVGVFDGVHRGHQALIRRICESPWLPGVVTFRQNPLKILNPHGYPGDIYSLEQKLRTVECLGVQLTILIDFSRDFSIMKGADFIDLLNPGGRLKLLALGRNFRCGYRLDTGVEEIQARLTPAGIETWIADPVREGAERISSSRIRRAIAAGNFTEASLLLGRPYEPRP